MYETGIPRRMGAGLPEADEGLEARNRCAYNQTRRCVLGVEVACGDFTHANLAERLPLLTPKSGAGLWLVPFRGIPVTDKSLPLDLIYLDANQRVIETVDFFPSYRVSPSSPPAASVLALPVHSNFASHTQPGDKLVFGLTEEIDRLIKQLATEAGSAVEEATEARPEAKEEPRSSGAATPRQREDRSGEAAPATTQTEEPAQAGAWKKPDESRSWLQRLLSPDPPEPRQATRATLTGLAAYFWTGGSPLPHAVSNISSTGLYVLTDERWYSGTLVQMTLKKIGDDGGVESSISVLARARRWGNDGVGMSFVVRDSRRKHRAKIEVANAVEREDLDRFLEQIKMKP
jgi:hypothetical protein